ncbi:MAG: inorganic phosphate transporter [Candidatus Goldiibacteriota bacterium]
MFGYELIVIFAVIVAFYSAVNIGGNDVANAMGTSVASKAVTYKQAVLIAAVFEFAGAFFVGSHVTNTVRKEMIDLTQFVGEPRLIIYGMTATLVGTTVWMRIATHFGWPVSTTHSIVGAVIGFGIIAKGLDVVQWGKVTGIAASWIISPISGGIMAFLIFTFIRNFILEAKNPVRRTKMIAPFLVAMVIYIIMLSLVYKGLANINLDLSFKTASIMALAGAFLGGITAKILIERHFKTVNNDGELNYKKVEKIFAVLQIITACYVAFAHGANDVANAVGPLAAIITVVKTNEVMMSVAVPMWILALGGGGIVLGLIVLGTRVMETIGKKITEIVPSRGFTAEFAAATTVLICSKMGLPVSTTHTIVGAVIGVGFARGIGALNLKVIGSIVSSWFITLPAAMLFTIITYKIILFFS